MSRGAAGRSAPDIGSARRTKAAPQTVEWLDVRPGAYHDSISLMRASQALTAQEGIDTALVAMATALNLDLLDRLGFELPAPAGPGDLVVAVRGAEAAVAHARTRLDELLEGARPPTATKATDQQPLTIGSAARQAEPPATLALISVPGESAYLEATEALDAGLNPMIFSDNVPLEQEVALKRTAQRRGLLVMGPDCGTAMIGGVGLGFANVVRAGPVGIVSASGTGAQQVMCLLDTAGVGVRHVLGVGGRDLSDEVGGRSTLAALHALDADPATTHILVISKPPAAGVAQLVRTTAEQLDTPVDFALLAAESTGGGGDLTAVAERLIRACGGDVPDWPSWPARAETSSPPRTRSGKLRGMFAGGTLCAEALLIGGAHLDGIASNITVPGASVTALPADLTAAGHAMIDFGDDRLTCGRAHPMLDPTLRLDHLDRAAADPACAVLLLDVVLGLGADPDPAATLAPRLEAARRRAASEARRLDVIVSLCGARSDPQDRDETARRLCEAGASVFVSNAAAVRHAIMLLDREPE